MSTDGVMQPAVMASRLRQAADDIDKLQGHGYWDAWSAVVRELDRGNRQWNVGSGRSGIQCAIDEIRRLYEADRTLQYALEKPRG